MRILMNRCSVVVGRLARLVLVLIVANSISLAHGQTVASVINPSASPAEQIPPSVAAAPVSRDDYSKLPPTIANPDLPSSSLTLDHAGALRIPGATGGSVP